MREGFFLNSGETHPRHRTDSRTPSREGSFGGIDGGETHPRHRTDNRTPSKEGNLNALVAWKSLAIITLIVFLLPSCKPDNLRQGAAKQYFDIKGYFENSIAKLERKQQTITKTVVHNGTSESKKVEIGNWKAELALFIESDINKPAWKGLYTVQDSAGTTIYTATDPDIRTRRIAIGKTAQGIKYISIYNEINNVLYSTRETLNYIPDSVYTIEKYQKVRLLGANTYKITGKFN